MRANHHVLRFGAGGVGHHVLRGAAAAIPGEILAADVIGAAHLALHPVGGPGEVGRAAIAAGVVGDQLFQGDIGVLAIVVGMGLSRQQGTGNADSEG